MSKREQDRIFNQTVRRIFADFKKLSKEAQSKCLSDVAMLCEETTDEKLKPIVTGVYDLLFLAKSDV